MHVLKRVKNMDLNDIRTEGIMSLNGGDKLMKWTIGLGHLGWPNPNGVLWSFGQSDELIWMVLRGKNAVMLYRLLLV